MATCEKNESLFQLKFSTDADGWLTPTTDIFWRLRYSSSARSLKDYYGSNVTDISECLSNDFCYRLDTEDMEPDAFTVMLEKKVLNPMRMPEPYESSKRIPTTTEFGSGCMPSCGDDEGLLDIEISQGWDRDILWQVEDSSGTVVYEREDEWNAWKNYNVYNWRKCLPRDDCYAYTIATRRYGGNTLFAKEITNYTVQWDGMIVKEGSGKNLTFTETTTQFGSNCQAPCAKGMSLFEAFVLEPESAHDRTPNMTWALNDERSGQAIFSGSVAESKGTVLHRVHECVPVSSTCLSFIIKVPEEHPNETRSMRVVYSVRHGGEYYRSHGLYFRNGSKHLPMVKNETTFVGTGCTSDLVCNSDIAESLLQVHHVTENKGPYASNDLWKVKYKNGTDLPDKYSTGSYDFVDYAMPSTQYRALSCLPRDECMFFAMNKEKSAADYTVVYDGDIHNQRTAHTDDWTSSDPWKGKVTTPLGCPSTSSLSTEAIVGIMLGSVFGLAIIEHVTFLCCKKKEASK